MSQLASTRLPVLPACERKCPRGGRRYPKVESFAARRILLRRIAARHLRSQSCGAGTRGADASSRRASKKSQVLVCDASRGKVKSRVRPTILAAY